MSPSDAKSDARLQQAGLSVVKQRQDQHLKPAAFFKVVDVSPVLLGDLHDNCQLPFGVEVHRPDRVPVACLT